MKETVVQKKGWKPTVADWFTLMRILGAVVLFFLAPFSLVFYIIYSLCGASDAVDGWIARATNTTTEVGAKLDSIADLLFYSAMVIKIMPTLIRILPMALWYGVFSVLAVRTLSYLTAAIKYKCFASMHTWMNKLTGLCMFCMPYLLEQTLAVGYCTATCVVAGLASAEEWLIHLFSKNYNSQVKTILKARG